MRERRKVKREKKIEVKVGLCLERCIEQGSSCPRTRERGGQRAADSRQSAIAAYARGAALLAG
jgi:hypothetical protein